MKTVVFINGNPRSGKDTVVDHTRHALMFPHQIKTHALSSIEPVRTMLRDNGFNVDRKTNAERDLLAEVGTAFEKYNGFRSTKCAEFVWKALDKEDGLVFLHTREPWLIDKIGRIIRDLMPDIEIKTLFVERPSAERVTSNAADANVEDMDYDIRIKNDGSLDDLVKKCDVLARLLVQGGTHEYARTDAGNPDL